MFNSTLGNTILSISARALEGEAAAQSPMASGISSILILVVFVAFMYFLSCVRRRSRKPRQRKCVTA